MKTTASSINRRLSREYPWEVGFGVYASPPLRWYVGGVSVGLNLTSGVFLHVRQSSPFMKIDSFKNLRKTNEKSLQNDSLLSQYVHSKQARRRRPFSPPPWLFTVVWLVNFGKHLKFLTRICYGPTTSQCNVFILWKQFFNSMETTLTLGWPSKKRVNWRWVQELLCNLEFIEADRIVFQTNQSTLALKRMQRITRRWFYLEKCKLVVWWYTYEKVFLTTSNLGIWPKYRSIEELQQQNQKLLGVIRELSEEKEKREGQNA